MLLPELPAYLSSLGGAEYKGLIIALFTLTAGLSRPFSGKLTDNIGRIPVMAIGSIVCFVCGFLYPVLGSVAGFLFIRLIHGFSTGFKPTATAAYVADIVPSTKWGEAMGIHGLCFSTGLGIGPAIGSAITMYSSIDMLFYCSSLFALLSIVIVMNMKETLPLKKRFEFSHLKIGRNEIIEKQVLPSAIITFLTYFSYGALITLIPDWSQHLGILNKGIFFLTFTFSSLLIRFAAGKISDQYGRILMLKVSTALIAFSMILIGHASGMLSLIIASIAYGIATGIQSPALNAWTIDLSHPDRRGKAVATMYIALEAGIGIGALVAGWLFMDNVKMIPTIFYISSLMSLTGLIYLIFVYKKRDADASGLRSF